MLNYDIEDENIEPEISRWHYRGLLGVLIFAAVALCAHLGYLYLADASHFPINTVKIAANFHRISRQQLATTMSDYQEYSFFSLPTRDLQRSLQSFGWADTVNVRRVWPDTLSIKLVEKEPIALWNKSLITTDGRVFRISQADGALELPALIGPNRQKNDILQIYQKLSKLLSSVGLNVAVLKLHENQSCDVVLTNGVKVRLGKQNLEQRLRRFCKAYQAVIAPRLAQVASVDMRYERGMAVQWKQQTGR